MREGLNMGADEYMLKPLGNIELPARISALLRRSGIDEEQTAIAVTSDDYLHGGHPFSVSCASIARRSA